LDVPYFSIKISQVNKYIRKAEVLENAVNLFELIIKLLEKVEELTIYLEEENKRIEAVEIELSEYRKMPSRV